MKLNENIAALRKKKGVTQEELAQVFGVTNQAVSKWETSQSSPDVALLPEIAAYFGVSVDALMGVEPSLNRIVSAVEDYVAQKGQPNTQDGKCWEVLLAAFSAWLCRWNEPTDETPEKLQQIMKPGSGNSCWSCGMDGGGLLYPPGLFVFRNMEEVPGGQDYDNMLTFCRCFAKEDNWRIVRALTWGQPKSAVELAAETGLDAETVEKAIAEDFGKIVESRYVLGLKRWSVHPWIKPLLYILGYSSF